MLLSSKILSGDSSMSDPINRINSLIFTFENQYKTTPYESLNDLLKQINDCFKEIHKNRNHYSIQILNLNTKILKIEKDEKIYLEYFNRIENVTDNNTKNEVISNIDTKNFTSILYKRLIENKKTSLNDFNPEEEKPVHLTNPPPIIENKEEGWGPYFYNLVSSYFPGNIDENNVTMPGSFETRENFLNRCKKSMLFTTKEKSMTYETSYAINFLALFLPISSPPKLNECMEKPLNGNGSFSHLQQLSERQFITLTEGEDEHDTIFQHLESVKIDPIGAIITLRESSFALVIRQDTITIFAPDGDSQLLGNPSPFSCSFTNKQDAKRFLGYIAPYIAYSEDNEISYSIFQSKVQVEKLEEFEEAINNLPKTEWEKYSKDWKLKNPDDKYLALQELIAIQPNKLFPLDWLHNKLISLSEKDENFFKNAFSFLETKDTTRFQNGLERINIFYQDPTSESVRNVVNHQIVQSEFETALKNFENEKQDRKKWLEILLTIPQTLYLSEQNIIDKIQKLENIQDEITAFIETNERACSVASIPTQLLHFANKEKFTLEDLPPELNKVAQLQKKALTSGVSPLKILFVLMCKHPILFLENILENLRNNELEELALLNEMIHFEINPTLENTSLFETVVSKEEHKKAILSTLERLNVKEKITNRDPFSDEFLKELRSIAAKDLPEKEKHKKGIVNSENSLSERLLYLKLLPLREDIDSSDIDGVIQVAGFDDDMFLYYEHEKRFQTNQITVKTLSTVLPIFLSYMDKFKRNDIDVPNNVPSSYKGELVEGTKSQYSFPGENRNPCTICATEFISHILPQVNNKITPEILDTILKKGKEKYDTILKEMKKYHDENFGQFEGIYFNVEFIGFTEIDFTKYFRELEQVGVAFNIKDPNEKKYLEALKTLKSRAKDKEPIGAVLTKDVWTHAIIINGESVTLYDSHGNSSLPNNHNGFSFTFPTLEEAAKALAEEFHGSEILFYPLRSKVQLQSNEDLETAIGELPKRQLESLSKDFENKSEIDRLRILSNILEIRPNDTYKKEYLTSNLQKLFKIDLKLLADTLEKFHKKDDESVHGEIVLLENPLAPRIKEVINHLIVEKEFSVALKNFQLEKKDRKKWLEILLKTPATPLLSEDEIVKRIAALKPDKTLFSEENKRAKNVLLLIAT